MDPAPFADAHLEFASASPADLRTRDKPKKDKDKSGASARKVPPSGKVSLNHATAADLAEIPGIGPKTALAIIDYRRAHGLFLDLKELVHVKGIGEKKLENISRFLMLSPVGEEEPLRQAGMPAQGSGGSGNDKP